MAMTIINTLNASGVAKVIAGEEKPTSFPSVYPAPDGYDGWSKMTIEAPDNLTAENIKKDVEIAGITGTYAGGSDGKFAKLCDRTITEVTADDLAGVTSLASYCFYKCTSLASITIPDGVTSIGVNCFSYCESLASIDIPDGVTSIGVNGFYMCTSLASITIPDGVTSLANYCFSYCESLASIDIPDGVTSIGVHCFYKCTSLASITIPDGVTYIGNYCFSYCTSLASITIPDGVTSLASYCFSYCTSLASIVMLPTTPPALGSNAFYNTSDDLVITVPKGTLDAYKSATNWSAYADKMVEASG
jgi:hypothetical protein